MTKTSRDSGDSSPFSSHLGSKNPRVQSQPGALLQCERQQTSLKGRSGSEDEREDSQSDTRAEKTLRSQPVTARHTHRKRRHRTQPRA